MKNWYPEKFFYSHASKDISLTRFVDRILKHMGYEIYIAERNLVGSPLIQKLREELINCNALLLGWTNNTSKKNSSQIISFEIGMAYSLGIPIYIIKTVKGKMPWFFDKLTDYANVDEVKEDKIRDALSKIEPFSFLHPIDLLIPKEKYFKYRDKNQSENITVVQDDDSLNIPKNFNGIIHFKLINRRPKPEKNVRIILKFPKEISIKFDAGSLEKTSKVQRNEIFDMRETSRGTIRMFWASLPPESFYIEIRLIRNNEAVKTKRYLECFCSSDNIIGWRKKEFLLQLI